MKRFRCRWGWVMVAALLLGLAAPVQAAPPSGMLGFLSDWFSSLWVDQDYEWELQREAREQAMGRTTAADFVPGGEPCPAGDATCGGGGGPMIIPRQGWQCTPQTPQFCSQPPVGGTNY